MRVAVPSRQACRLLNHGPTTLVTSAHSGRRNVMAAAWVTAVDFEPPKLSAIIAEGTYTRELVDTSGVFGICLPSVRQLDAVYGAGNRTGRGADKLAALGLETFPGSHVDVPLVEGCLAWLECRVLESLPQYDLFVAQVLAAWADDAVFANGQWRFDDPTRRTVHHVSKGVFFATGERLEAKPQ